jgi:hypothetical protein
MFIIWLSCDETLHGGTLDLITYARESKPFSTNKNGGVFNWIKFDIVNTFEHNLRRRLPTYLSRRILLHTQNQILKTLQGTQRIMQCSTDDDFFALFWLKGLSQLREKETFFLNYCRQKSLQRRLRFCWRWFIIRRFI